MRVDVALSDLDGPDVAECARAAEATATPGAGPPGAGPPTFWLLGGDDPVTAAATALKATRDPRFVVRVAPGRRDTAERLLAASALVDAHPGRLLLGVDSADVSGAAVPSPTRTPVFVLADRVDTGPDRYPGTAGVLLPWAAHSTLPLGSAGKHPGTGALLHISYGEAGPSVDELRRYLAGALRDRPPAGVPEMYRVCAEQVGGLPEFSAGGCPLTITDTLARDFGVTSDQGLCDRVSLASECGFAFLVLAPVTRGDRALAAHLHAVSLAARLTGVAAAPPGRHGR